MPKNWDRIVRDLSSPDSSDAEDDLNIMSLQKNASRAAQLVHSYVPGLDTRYSGDVPMGRNNPITPDAITRVAASLSCARARPSVPPEAASHGEGEVRSSGSAPSRPFEVAPPPSDDAKKETRPTGTEDRLRTERENVPLPEEPLAEGAEGVPPPSVVGSPPDEGY
jgi:hypothetical protein